jgi:hypothetical protein
MHQAMKRRQIFVDQPLLMHAGERACHAGRHP